MSLLDQIVHPSRHRADDEPAEVPLGGTRADAAQRAQIGITGLVVIVVMVGLAQIVLDRAQISEDSVVPEAAATTEPSEAVSNTDPLADAGVVPDLPADPEQVVQEEAILPEQGEVVEDLAP